MFLSFCSQDCDIADIVENNLDKYIIVNRWESKVGYRESFRVFMDSAKDHNYLFSIISDRYLKSRACMYEIGKIIDEPSFQKNCFLLFYLIMIEFIIKNFQLSLSRQMRMTWHRTSFI